LQKAASTVDTLSTSYLWDITLAVSALAIPIMRYLARRKITLAERLGSRAMRADAAESLTCGWLSFVVLVSLLAQAAFGAWWIDPVGSLAIVWFLVREGLEAWAGEKCECAKLGP
jgi:divalent metal cation (Fe/Co/Zn/Cd) transporter